MLFFPIGVDVAMARWPWMNWVIMAVTFFCFFACWRGDEPTEFLEYSIAGGDHWIGHLLHPLAHFDIVHLAGNLIFLWVFGNAICAKIGNLWYPVAYFGGALFASLIETGLAGGGGIGASAAIDVIVGMFLVWYALNTVTMFFWILIRGGQFELSAYWVILIWLAFDIWGAVQNNDGVGHLAHIIGLVLGVAAGFALLKLGWVTMDDDERSLLDLWREKQETKRPTGRPQRGMARSMTHLTAPIAAKKRSVVDDDAPIPLSDEPSVKREIRPIERDGRTRR